MVLILVFKHASVTWGHRLLPALPEVFVVKSQMPSGVFLVEGLVSKTRKVAAADTFYPVTLVRRAEIDDEGLSVLRNKNAELMTERQSFVFQLDALKAEILSWQKKADIIDSQLQLWKEAANQRQQSLTEYKETSKKLRRQVDSIEADYAAAITAVEESRSREQNLVEELQLQAKLSMVSRGNWKPEKPSKWATS